MSIPLQDPSEVFSSSASSEAKLAGTSSNPAQDTPLKSEPSLPLITLITACYNSAPFIRRLADSLVNQTCSNFEWICVDDGSTDATVEILKSIRMSFPVSMRIYRLPCNSGGGLALGVASLLANGALIGVMDHDDQLIDTAIETAASDWMSLSKDQSLGGLFYRTRDPLTQTLNGPDFTSGIYNYSYFFDHLKRHSEFWPLIEKTALQRCLSLETAEKFCLWGPILEDVAAIAPFHYEAKNALRLYHRDNVHSQTNSVRITRKTVWTYSRMFRRFDTNKLFNTKRYLPLLLNLMRFSKAVYGTPWKGVNMIDNSCIRLFARAIFPLYFILQTTVWRSVTAREAPEIETKDLMQRIESF